MAWVGPSAPAARPAQDVASGARLVQIVSGNLDQPTQTGRLTCAFGILGRVSVR